MIILVDMDDVLEQLVPGWVRYINERFGTDVRPEDVSDWNMSRAFPNLSREQVYSAVCDDALWDYVMPMPGAPETLQTLLREGHQVYIVTATDYQTLRAKMEKVLFRYFPFISWDQVIVTNHKHLIQGDVLIDDGPHNLTEGSYRKILFHANHNRGFDETSVGAVRVYNWEQALEQIHRIERELSEGI